MGMIIHDGALNIRVEILKSQNLPEVIVQLKSNLDDTICQIDKLYLNKVPYFSNILDQASEPIIITLSIPGLILKKLSRYLQTGRLVLSGEVEEAKIILMQADEWNHRLLMMFSAFSIFNSGNPFQLPDGSDGPSLFEAMKYGIEAKLQNFLTRLVFYPH